MSSFRSCSLMSALKANGLQTAAPKRGQPREEKLCGAPDVFVKWALMPSPIPSEITQSAERGRSGSVPPTGDAGLRRPARHRAGISAKGGRGDTLQATGLVNELYLKLAKVRGVALKDRRHFFAFAAQLMRMILIDYSRQAKALKRPTSSERVPLHEEMAWVDAASEEMLALNTAPG